MNVYIFLTLVLVISILFSLNKKILAKDLEMNTQKDVYQEDIQKVNHVPNGLVNGDIVEILMLIKKEVPIVELIENKKQKNI